MQLFASLASILFLTVFTAYADEEEKTSQNETIPKPDVTSLHVLSNIRYRYAQTLVSSRVKNPANVSQEVTFYVVLPETAFITGFVMTIKEKNYEAYVKEKEEAKEVYNQAVSLGLSAAHVAYSARDSNEFTVSLNVEPHTKVTFNLTYEQLLERTLSNYKHEININPGQIVEDMEIRVEIKESLPIINLKVPDLQTTNEIQEVEKDNPLAKIERPESDKAIIVWAPTKEQQKELKAEGIKGQFVVHYDVDRSENPEQILVDEGYFVHFYANDKLTPLNKHVVFILDLSGSMHGRKLQQVKEAMDNILSELDKNDYFSLVLFSDTADAWAPNKTHVRPSYTYSFNQREKPLSSELTGEYIVPADDKNVTLAKEFISTLDDLGGTNIIAGLRMGIKLTKIGKSLLSAKQDYPEPLIIFLTDGEPNVEMSNPNEITAAVKELNSLRVPIFSLGFGDGADLKFLRNLSLANSGFARNIYEAADAAIQLKNFFKEIASPLMSNITFEYLPGQVDSNTTQTHFNTLFSGSELVVVGKLLSESLGGALLARSPSGNEEISFCKPVIIDHIPDSPVTKNRTYGHLERMWAYKSIAQLLDKNIVEQNDTIKAMALDLALKYSFVTPLTSLVVVKPNETSEVDAKKSTPNTGLPLMAGAASGFMHGAPAYLSAMKAPLAPGVYVMRRPQIRPQNSEVSGLPMTTPFSYPGPPAGAGFGGARPPGIFNMLPPRIPLPASEDKADGEVYHSEPSLPYVLTNYTNVAWLEKKTIPLNRDFLHPPKELQTSDLIALNQPKIEAFECNVNGTEGKCTHFIHCVLELFVDDVSAFEPWKCHIEPNYVGVCCPKNVFDSSEI